MASVVTFISYVLAGNDLTAATAFATMSLFFIIRMPFVILPMAVPMFAECLVALERFSKYFERETGDIPARNMDPAQVGALSIKEGNFRYPSQTSTSEEKKGETKEEKKEEGKEEEGKEEEKQDQSKTVPPTEEAQAEAPAKKNEAGGESEGSDMKMTLEGINLQVSPGELVVVVGSVGSGKSSLLSAILDEIPAISGETTMAGSVAYADQQPYVTNNTLRDNILFGRPYDQEKYKKCLDDCALLTDLSQLPAGDMTEIGERGVTLSGGQKARVSLARTVYSDADIYLLDDPLAAVDAHVARALYDQVITGCLASKTVIFVTNHVHFLPDTTRVVAIADGRIVADGVKAELQAAIPEMGVSIDAAEETPPDAGKAVADGQTVKDAPKEAAEPSGKAGDGSGTLVKAEKRVRGNVQNDVYTAYLLAGTGGRSWLFPFLVLAFVVAETAWVSIDIWLALWTNDAFDMGTSSYIGVYLGLSFGMLFFWSFRSVLMQIFGITATQEMHRQMLDAVMRCPLSFFESTPMGRLISRFSKDVNELDTLLVDKWQWLTACFCRVVSILIIIIVAAWPFAVVLPFLIGLYLMFHQYYRRSSRELKRLDNLSNSPLYSQFGETLSGLSTIHAYRAEEQHLKHHDRLLDDNTRALFASKMCEIWLAQRLMFIGALVVFFCGFSLVLLKEFAESASAGLGGLALAYSLNVVINLNMVIRNAADVETKMTSVERVLEYSEYKGVDGPGTLVPEAAMSITETKPAQDWPQKGEIVLSNLSMRYREDLPIVLDSISVSFAAGENIGICGRTGSGKSSMMLCLFRIVEACGGTITIDGVDISKIGLLDLRAKLTIIPQDPVLFSGSVRANVDLVGVHDDASIWSALDRAGLGQAIREIEQVTEAGITMKPGLDSNVTEGGLSLSAGQRQLMCLSRALLRNTKILLLDEATASVDSETDEQVQRTIRSEFGDATCLVIAHRLDTIIDSSRILVLDNGSLAEFDTPHNLLQKPQGIFTSLVEELGEDSAKHLRAVAAGETQLYSEAKP